MQNFGKIKQTFNSLLVESLTNSDTTNKLLFKEYLKSVKKSEVLKAQFNVYYNLEHKHETDINKSFEYVKENINILQKFGEKVIIEENNKLVVILKKYGHDISEDMYPKTELHESITKLIFTKKKANTIDTIMESMYNVTGYIEKNIISEDVKRDIIPSSILGNIMVEKFNEKYGSLTEDTQRIIKTVLNANNDGKIEIMEDLKNDCIHLLNDKLKECDEGDVDYKGKLLDVKETILNMRYVSENFVSDISRIIELKEDLTNE